jgi:hypothetical protein
MGQWRRDGAVIAGRIGYERPGEVAELWDAARRDFVERRLVEGLTSPFVLDPRTGIIVFQLRASRIKPQSFAGAFRSLLNEVAPREEWRVEYIVQGEPWHAWEDRAKRIVRLEVRVERPNPHFGGRRDIESFVEDHRARAVKIILDAYKDDPQGLTLDEFLRQAVDQALYQGSVKAVAEFDTAHGIEQRVWRSDVEGSPEETTVPLDPETGDASAEAMREELEELEEEQYGDREGACDLCRHGEGSMTPTT